MGDDWFDDFDDGGFDEPLGGSPLGGDSMGGNPLGGSPLDGGQMGSDAFGGAPPLGGTVSGLNGSGDNLGNSGMDGKPFNYKMIGLALAGGLLVIAVILVLLGKASSGGNQPSEGYYEDSLGTVGSEGVDSGSGNVDLGSARQDYIEVTEEPVSVTSVPVPEGEVHGVENDGVTLTLIPDNMEMDLSGDTHYVTGAVSGKERLLQDGQVVCRVTIVADGYSFYYYCAYNAFDAVGEGDILTVAYKKVSDTCITILSVEFGSGS